MIKATDIAWAAGFLEGDGYFGWQKPAKGWRRTPHKGQLTYSVPGKPVVTAIQNSREPLEKLESILGGSVTGPYAPSELSDNPRFQWKANSADRALKIMKQVYPYLSTRRRKQVDNARKNWGHTKGDKRDD